MKVLIVSDTHRHDSNLETVIEMEKPFDRLIHLGDVEGSKNRIMQMADCPTDIVAGNNDYFSDLPKEKDVMVGPYRALLTHGHYYYVYSGTERIRREAKQRGFDIVMYGHTHRPRVDRHGNMVILNPGSLTYPRQEGRRPSYIVMVINEDGSAEYEIKYL